ncbi:hypothetical protein [Streptomyces purpurascens]|uniref:hypothetical protein n=1 Tax=Streptomyces purpurascens TaxID=1924 RepID=UPI0016771EA4|nr:hypothetical protein [Streptomyces purpurascens]MCE7051972.1 hypothetical protein [Streptomyces purpurascens]GHA46527.1 hypothetical protein GCM10010303_67120 [Streptomyces purpurascens]
MSGRADSDTDAEIADSEAAAVQEADQDEEPDDAPDEEPGDDADDPDDDDDDDPDADDPDDDDPDEDEPDEDARRARWTAAGTGALLTLAGLAAALLRLTRPAPALVPAAYACGAVVCAGAAVLGSRGRTRRALWLLIAGTMVMALGDQFD